MSDEQRNVLTDAKALRRLPRWRLQKMCLEIARDYDSVRAQMRPTQIERDELRTENELLKARDRQCNAALVRYEKRIERLKNFNAAVGKRLKKKGKR